MGGKRSRAQLCPLTWGLVMERRVRSPGETAKGLEWARQAVLPMQAWLVPPGWQEMPRPTCPPTRRWWC